MKLCTRCRQPHPLHMLFHIYAAGGGSRTYYCGPCRERWLEAEAQAAEVVERGQASVALGATPLTCADCHQPNPRRNLRGDRCRACYYRLLRQEGRIA